MTLPSQVAAMNAGLKKERERQRGWGGGMESYGLMGTEFLFGMVESVLEVDSGYSCITFQMHFLKIFKLQLTYNIMLA